MIYVAPTSPRPVVFSDNATLSNRYFTIEALVVQTGANKTFTLPTPTRELAGKATWFSNYSTGSLTLSGAFTSGTSYVIDPKTTQLVVVLPVGASTYKWHVVASVGYTPWTAFTDGGTISYGTNGTETFVFTTAAPASPTTVYRYRVIGRTVDVAIYLSSNDGSGGVPVSVKLPVAPKDNSALTSVVCNQLVNTTWASKVAYIDTSTSRITIVGGSTCTDDAPMALSITATYEVS